MSYPSLEGDDGTLVVRMAAGDEQALGALYDRWQSVVRATVLRVVPNAMDADDLVEEVFWQAWRQAARFDAARGAVSTWLLTIARSRALDRLRALKRSREEPGLDGIDEGTGWDGDAVVAPDPMEVTDLRDRGRLVRDALATLPPEQRDVVSLAYFDGLSQTEIAERTGEALGTVKTRTRLALRKLRTVLGVLNEEGA